MSERHHAARTVLVRGGHIIDPASDFSGPADLLIDGDRIAARDAPGRIPGDHAEIIDATGLYVVPGLIDIHVHFREPGYEYKETIATGSLSAVVGGVTSVACMANTNPVNDNGAVTQYIIERARLANLANVFPIGAVSVGLEGKCLAEFGEMYEAGIVAVSDDGMPIMDANLMRRALEYARMFGFPVIVHEEDTDLCCNGAMNEGVVSAQLGIPGLPSVGESAMVARDVELARYTGGRLHVAHLSTAESVEIVRRAKHDGLSVTAEAAPHHFTLDETACEGYNTNAKMYPPLRTEKDVRAVRAGLADGTIDTIATDHAPHHRDEKRVHFDDAARGIVGLESLLPLSLALVAQGEMSIEKVVAALTWAPAKNLGLDRGTLAVGVPADITIFDAEREWTLDATTLASKSKNTPFDRWSMRGRVIRTIVGGRSRWGEER